MRTLMSMRVGTGVLASMVAIALVSGALPAVPAVIIAGVAFVVLGGWEAYSAYTHRDQAEKFARAHGWEHVPRTAAYSTRFTGMPFDLVGDSVRQEDVLRGTYAGLRCAAFTHVVETQRQGESAVVQCFHVTLAELPVALPRLDIVPENLAHHVAQALGGIDIEVESHEFNARWRVIARDRKYGHDVIDPRMIERLLAWDAHGRSIRIDGGAVMVWGPGREGVDTLAKRLDVVVGVARRIPAHVLRRYEEQGHAMREPDAPLTGPDWATTPGALTSRRYTGIGAEDEPLNPWRDPEENPSSGA